MMMFMILFLLAIFSSLLESMSPALSYITEIIVFGFIVAAAIKLLFLEKGQVKSLDVWAIVTLLLCSLFGLIAFIPNLFNGAHNTILMQVYTFFGMTKFLLMFYCGRILLKNTKFKSTILWMKRIAWSFSLVCSAAYVLNLVFPIMTGFDIRFGMSTYAYGFGHPAPFSMVVLLFTVLMVFFSLIQKTRLPYVYLLLNLGLVFTAGRSTAIGIYVCLFLLLLLFPYIKRLPAYVYVLLGGFLTWFSWERIADQFGAGNMEARGVLLRTSVEIAEKHAPFGAGLGMFGSNASRLHYSPLYWEYQISRVWGLSSINPSFITDSYWAMIIGETGLLGVIILIVLFIVTVFAIIRSTSGDFKIKLMVVFPFLYALCTSPVDTLLVSGSIVSVMMAVLYMMSLSKEVANEDDFEEGI
ncbi:hypothetical protein PWEIH_09788 [Listeria weihenstephanensis FSL R9-0317]|uniref:Uncharacterized protein n=1 Tax=Listeria weihenstephanensis TaxID=1006155 RepID=A0A1S7FY30_9LIST|nr:hypothetical protein [Listeria weihenstephanensis]AQY52323.1 hypothetical protein UE46_15755 [Listeria weihenstephanensis]EUJ38279.1 hypothetical protein PWEIH_09788 [Listeria weihenstephanensis FSL R9-0317]